MTQWKVPPDTSQKEKIVGGVLTAAQLLWMILGLGLAAILSISLGPAIGLPGIIFGLVVGLGTGCIFCFYKKNGLPLFTWLRLKKKFKTQIKELPHRQTIMKDFGGDI